MTSLFSQFGAWYNGYLDASPLLVKALTTAAIGLIGDSAAQYHEERLRRRNRCNNDAGSAVGAFVRQYNMRRGLANVANNVFLTAPIYHYGYDLLESLIPVNDDGMNSNSVMGDSLAALSQVLIDCILFDALFVFLMFMSAGLIEGRYSLKNEENTNTNAKSSSISTSNLSLAIRNNLVPAIVASWKINIFVIPVEYILFRYFPLRLRVLGMNVIDLVWDAVVSFVIHDERKESDNYNYDNTQINRKGQPNELNKTMVMHEKEMPIASTPPSTPWSSPSSTLDEVDSSGHECDVPSLKQKQS